MISLNCSLGPEYDHKPACQEKQDTHLVNFPAQKHAHTHTHTHTHNLGSVGQQRCEREMGDKILIFLHCRVVCLRRAGGSPVMEMLAGNRELSHVRCSSIIRLFTVTRSFFLSLSLSGYPPFYRCLSLSHKRSWYVV